jgi:hypothetical protein
MAEVSAASSLGLLTNLSLANSLETDAKESLTSACITGTWTYQDVQAPSSFLGRFLRLLIFEANLVVDILSRVWIIFLNIAISPTHRPRSIWLLSLHSWVCPISRYMSRGSTLYGSLPGVSSSRYATQDPISLPHVLSELRHALTVECRAGRRS